MWQENQNIILRGQPTFTPGRRQGPHLVNTISGNMGVDSLGGSSRKRNYSGLHLNQPEFVESANSMRQIGNPFHPQDVVSETLPKTNAIFSINKGRMDPSYNAPHQVLQSTPESYASCQPEAGIRFQFQSSFAVDLKKPQFAINLQGLRTSQSKNQVSLNNGPLEIGFSHQNFIQPNRVSGSLNQKAKSLEEFKAGMSCNGKHSDFYPRSEGVDVKSASCGSSIITEQGLSNGNGDGKLKEMTMLTDAETPKLTLVEEKSVANPVSHDNIVERGPLKLDNKSTSEKEACTVAEKLWDGSLQLSSTVTLSAMAFFKSGEKLLDASWPGFLEVKGKVKLEAFEKFVQELARSRSRGLMVISLCWKEGSSESGLAGMKEVARGYKKGKRVGVAPLSQGTDLYICPRNDTIITILAKSGFFKGMAAIDGNRDSLIVCVVWRKNRTSANSVVKPTVSETIPRLEQPLKAPSPSSGLPSTEDKSSPIKSTQESHEAIPPVKTAPSSENIKNTGGSCYESGNTEFGTRAFLTIQGIRDSNLGGSSDTTLAIAPLPINLSSMDVEKSTPTISNLPIPILLHNSVKLAAPNEDDDLPEYDFAVSCGEPPISVSNRRENQSASNTQKKLENMNHVGNPSAVNQGNTKYALGSKIANLPLSEGKHVIHSRTKEGCFGELPKKKKLFDGEDDDMPEWCPPEFHDKPSIAIIRPSLAMVSTSAAFPNFPLPNPRRHLISSPTPPAYLRQTVHPASSSATTNSIRTPPLLPLQSSPSSSMDINSNPTLLPPPVLSNPNLAFPFSRRR